MNKKTHYIATKEDQGKFHFFKALEVDKNGFVKTFKDEKTGQFFLKGAGTNTIPDKEDEHPSVAFIEKSKSNVLGLNVFLDHDHKVKDTVGFISEVGGNIGELILTTALENPEINKNVKMVLEKIDHGTKIAYSIGGKVTKASEYYHKDLKRKIVKFDEGFITELTLTPYAAAYETDVAQVQKTFMKVLGTMEKIDPEDCSEFWKDFEKAENKYGQLKLSQPSVEDLSKVNLTSDCFAEVGDEEDSSTWKYLYSWNPSGTNKDLHIEGLDLAWQAVNDPENKASEETIMKLKKAREELKLDSRTLYFLDFNKAVSSSLEELLEDKETNQRLRDIVSIFDDASWTVLYDNKKGVKEKFEDISSYAKELILLLNDEFKLIKEKAIDKIVALSLTMDEVLVMKNKEVKKTNVEEIEDVLDETMKAELTSVVKSVVTKAFESFSEKEEKEEIEDKEDKIEKKLEDKDKDSLEEFIIKTIKSEFENNVSRSDKDKVDKTPEGKEKSIKPKTDEDKVEISEDLIALHLVKFFESHPDLKITGRKKSYLKTLERDQGVDINEIVNDEEKFKALDDDDKKKVIGKYFSGSLS